MDKTQKIEKILSREPISIKNDVFCFIKGNELPIETAGKGIKGLLQDYFKKRPALYGFLVTLFSPVLENPIVKKKVKIKIDSFDDSEIIVNIGSGPGHYLNRSDIINIDIFAFNNIDIIANASDLPIKKNSVDLALSIAALEHIENATETVNQIHRILKSKGMTVCYVPFLVPFHAAPNDYYRWTEHGLQKLFKDFKNVEICVGVGPTSALLWVFEEWLATFLSFGSTTLHDILFLIIMLILWPIKYLDLLVNLYPTSSISASGFFIFAEK